MGGCNEDWSERSRKQLSAPAAGYRKIRAFLSAGKADSIAKPTHPEAVQKSLKSNGVRNLRLEYHDGGHSLLKDHFVAALKWWAEPD